jgi:hypothetical protein
MPTSAVPFTFSTPTLRTLEALGSQTVQFGAMPPCDREGFLVHTAPECVARPVGVGCGCQVVVSISHDA